MEQFEIERKYLIEMPDRDFLTHTTYKSGGEIWKITQTYLKSTPEVSARIRRTDNEGKIIYTLTEKRKISDMRRIENEHEITVEEYEEKLKESDPELSAISKTRFRIPDGDHVWEIDIFPFWIKQAYLEIELESEEEKFTLPEYIKPIREVTYDKSYTNLALARKIPEE